ncbi:MAG: hypothetical protein M3463_15915 [Verrucomicrobiota bacterium]|nr:hypothetical protein [Verrucomicrobiota bacterium]
MSISELLPAVRSLPDADKLRLIRILSKDLASSDQSRLEHVVGELPVWSPHTAFDAAETLLSALQADEQPPAHA